MQSTFDPRAPRKATNLSINADLLNKARQLGINLSARLEQALADVVRQREREAWLAANREAIAAYNDQVEAHGVFSEGLRSF
jgi:antitoxin CcdA